MSKQNRFKQTLALGAVVIIALTTVLSTPAARAQRDEKTRIAVNVLPPVGIALGQTLSVTFLNTGASPLEIIPCIFDGDGAHLKTGERLRLAPGQMRSFNLSRGEIGGRTESRTLLRAGVHADEADLKNLVVAGEVIEDATSKSSLYVPGVLSGRAGFDPQPDPPAHR